jgi:hypothetical protein
MNIEMEILRRDRRIVVTRSKEQAAGSIEKLEALGAHPNPPHKREAMGRLDSKLIGTSQSVKQS